MIPADVASQLRPLLPDQPSPVQPVAPAAKLADVLSDLVPGQRVMAEIQALLPNGTYRAMISQREVVLSLPSAAKAGDSLELEVVESDGKVALAFRTNHPMAEQAGKGSESVSATLSQAGKLIGGLLGGIDGDGKRPSPAPLNGNQPLVATFPKDAAELVPLLKQALVQSGLFYESHLARWVEGRLPQEALLQEPQGKLSTAAHGLTTAQPEAPLPPGGSAGRPGDRLIMATPADSATATANAAARDALETSAQPQIHPDTTPLVRQQLDALATQNFAWQGQIWPGQPLQWEIEKDGGGGRDTDDDATGRRWQTRLRLSLPILGGIDAAMQLGADGAVSVSLVTDSDRSRERLISAGERLRQQLDDAGLNLAALAVQHGEPPG